MTFLLPPASNRSLCLCQGQCRGHDDTVFAPSQNEAPASGLSRRHLLRAGMAATAAGVLAGAIGTAAPTSALAQSTMSPDEALQALMDGNQRFISRKMTSDKEDLAILQANTVDKQEPFASVLSCADSRVPVELLFDQSIGHVFVNRVAGNIATSEIIGSIEYGVAVLGTRVLMVLGHSSCGAAKAAITAKAVPGQISALYRYIRPAVDAAGGDLVKTIQANAQIQAKLLKESSPVIADAIKGGTLKVVAAYYDLASGQVALLE
ncbi:carbonic anhydrase [Hypericibacter sp.]|uniref:carbonic anhydrase n=1 Tax=Hypericibacter sp. TaxID=2705401 RepID=UPI003D6D2C03